MLAGKPIEGGRLFDGFLDPSDAFWAAGSPFGDPCGEVLARLFNGNGDHRASAAPAGGRRWPCGAGGRVRCAGSERSSVGTRLRGGPRGRPSEALHDRRRRDELDAVEAAPTQSDEEVFLGGAAFPVRHGNARLSQKSPDLRPWFETLVFCGFAFNYPRRSSLIFNCRDM